MALRYNSFGFSDAGKLRDRNEDCYLCNHEHGLFVVADGMGGHALGERASRLAVSCVEEFVIRSRTEGLPWPVETNKDLSPEQNRLWAAAVLANQRIFQVAEADPKARGMGTTLTGALVEADDLAVVNVGDSRLYRIRDGKMAQITKDHTLVEELVTCGKITQKEALRHPQRHILTSALGILEETRMDVLHVGIEPGDIFLICSDGLYNMLNNSEIHETISNTLNGDLYKSGLSLIAKANMAGGGDNITVVLLAFNPA